MARKLQMDRIAPNNLKDIRSKKGITQREAARDMHIPYGTYAVIESGIQRPGRELREKIAAFYKVKQEDIWPDA